MEKRSTHYGDVAKWIEKVIDSCETREQTFVAKRLIRNFYNQLDRKLGAQHYFTSTISPLEYRLSNKRQEIQSKYFI
jgi:hypothetical protein